MLLLQVASDEEGEEGERGQRLRLSQSALAQLLSLTQRGYTYSTPCALEGLSPTQVILQCSCVSHLTLH